MHEQKLLSDTCVQKLQVRGIKLATRSLQTYNANEVANEQHDAQNWMPTLLDRN